MLFKLSCINYLLITILYCIYLKVDKFGGLKLLLLAAEAWLHRPGKGTGYRFNTNIIIHTGHVCAGIIP